MQTEEYHIMISHTFLKTTFERRPQNNLFINRILTCNVQYIISDSTIAYPFMLGYELNIYLFVKTVNCFENCCPYGNKV